METFDNTEWVLIYSTNEIYKADILIELLEEHGILTQQMNKKDSSFAIGEIEIFVNQNDYNSSIQIIEDHPDL